jgi:C1A family cysteine protease
LRALRAARYASEEARVKAHNRQRSNTWTERVNEFAVLSETDRRRTLGHTLAPFPKTRAVRPPARTVRAPLGASASRRVPTSLDWRTQGMVTPVKNQVASSARPPLAI